MTEAHAALLKELRELYFAIGTVRTVLERKQVTRTKDDDAQENMLCEWQMKISHLMTLAAETVPLRESPDLDDNGHPMDGN